MEGSLIYFGSYAVADSDTISFESSSQIQLNMKESNVLNS